MPVAPDLTRHHLVGRAALEHEPGWLDRLRAFAVDHQHAAIADALRKDCSWLKMKGSRPVLERGDCKVCSGLGKEQVAC